MNKKQIVFWSLLLASSLFGNAQTSPRKLGPALNDQSFNYSAPFISLDGSIISFMFDYTDDNTSEPFIALRQGVDWKEPVAIPKKITALSFRRGFTFSPDGKTIYITSKGGYSQGGFDILVSQLSGTTFSEPQTLGPPINSSTNDASPTFSPDGNLLFFMRCGKMDFNSASECKVMMARKRNGMWETPTELPASINRGNSQMPRILGDGQTLVFSSNRHSPNKGGMDFYMSKFSDSGWSEVINLEFANTAADEVYCSFTSLGRTLIKDVKGERRFELIEVPFPLGIRPNAVTRVIGQVTGIPELTKAYVTVVNLESKQITTRITPDKSGNFNSYLTEGSVYGVYVDPPTDQYRYAKKRYDLREGNKVPAFDRMSVSLQPVKSGDQIELSEVYFQPHSSQIEPTSIIELQKLSKMIRGNPNLKFKIDVSLYGLVKDSVANEDLTEVVTDTVMYEKEFQIDSVTIEIRDSIAVEYTYHNDRTEKQANAIVSFMLQQGVKPENLSISHQALEEPLAEKRRTAIYLWIR